MALGLEPVFASGGSVWPLAGAALAALEPDDPGPAIPRGALLREAPEPIYIVDQSARLADTPPEPLGVAAAPQAARRRTWIAALAASCVFHAAVAMFFIGTNSEEALLEGVELSGIAFLGSAPEDQLSAGEVSEQDDPNAVAVTMITMLEAQKVETVETEAVPAAESAEPVETVEAVPPQTETLEPVAEQPSAQVPSGEPLQAAPVEQAEPALPASAAPSPPATEAPRVLATDTLQPVEDAELVPEIAEAAPAEITQPAGAVQAAIPDSAKAAPVETPPTETVEPMETAALEPTVSEIVKTEIVEAQTVEAAPDIPLDRIPLPTPRPTEQPVDTAQQAEPVKQAAPKAKRETKVAEKPAKKPGMKATSKTRRSGNAGRNEADAQRGQADGRADGRTAAKSKGGKNSAAGNAAVSNYPGKVASKLRRALRYPAEAKRQKLRGQAQVSFVVSASGGVGSIRVVSSSGSPILDRAAIETVRRAAPFPAIPAGAARSSWPFTVPLAFNR